jgi:hypothetical protein
MVPASGKRLTLRDDVRCELGPGLLKDFKFDLTATFSCLAGTPSWEKPAQICDGRRFSD